MDFDAHADSSVRRGLTWRKEAWFSAAMTQRNIQHPHHRPARRAARSIAIAQTKRVDTVVLNVALVALVLVVVVLITPFTGAG